MVVVGWLDRPTLGGCGAVAVHHPLGWHLGGSYMLYKSPWGWGEMRWWWWWNLMSKLRRLPKKGIFGKSAEPRCRMSRRTRDSHIVNSVSRFDRDSLQGWIIHP